MNEEIILNALGRGVDRPVDAGIYVVVHHLAVRMHIQSTVPVVVREVTASSFGGDGRLFVRTFKYHVHAVGLQFGLGLRGLQPGLFIRCPVQPSV